MLNTDYGPSLDWTRSSWRLSIFVTVRPRLGPAAAHFFAYNDIYSRPIPSSFPASPPKINRTRRRCCLEKDENMRFSYYNSASPPTPQHVDPMSIKIKPNLDRILSLLLIQGSCYYWRMFIRLYHLQNTIAIFATSESSGLNWYRGKRKREGTVFTEGSIQDLHKFSD